jgi:hypothetical protein
MNKQIPRMRSQPRQLVRISINTRGQFSFWQVVSELQSSNLCALQCLVLCAGLRRASIVAATTSRSCLAWTNSWLGFGLSDQLLLMRYPWGKVRYPLFGFPITSRICLPFRNPNCSPERDRDSIGLIMFAMSFAIIL